MVGDYINYGITTENIVSTGVTTSYAVVDYSDFLPESRIELISYGARDTATEARLTASDDGTNTSAWVGYSLAANEAATHIDAWGTAYTDFFLPFSTTRQFISTAGTIDLLVQKLKLKR